MGIGVLILWLLPTIASAAVIRETYQEFEEIQPCQTYIYHDLLHIDCSSRGLSDIIDELDRNVQVLLLSNNEFDSVPAQLENFTSLKKVDLSSNRLSSRLPSFIEKLQHLETLNLSNNYYETWMSSSHKYNIQILDLSKNKINRIEEDAFDCMPNLHSLDLSENNIYDLPFKLFDSLNNLAVLILSNNYFTKVPRLTSSSLRTLNLSNCNVISLNAKILSELHSLLHLDLTYNQIEYLPDDLASNTLQELLLGYNGLFSLSDRSLSSLPHLAVLDLRGNNFREIWSTTLFASNLFLREIHVSGNRWDCEGFGVNLLLTFEYLTKEPAKVADEQSLMCYSPANVTQLTWQQAYIRTWLEESSSPGSFTMVAVMIGFVVGILLTSIICRAILAVNRPDDRVSLPHTDVTIMNVNGNSQTRIESVIMRIPLHDEDLPPSYDEALLMPRSNTSFHSLPDFIDEEPVRENRGCRRSRSFGDLTGNGLRMMDRRSLRRTYYMRNN